MSSLSINQNNNFNWQPDPNKGSMTLPKTMGSNRPSLKLSSDDLSKLLDIHKKSKTVNSSKNSPTAATTTGPGISATNSGSNTDLALNPETTSAVKKGGLKKKGGMRRQVSRSTGDLTGLAKKRNISFGNKLSIRTFEKDIDNDDEKHKNQVWFSNSEMKNIKKGLRKDVKMGVITRGLEAYEAGRDTSEKRRSHSRTILSLQQQQRRNGIQDDHSFHLLSRAMSGDDLKRAQELAQKDTALAFQEHVKTPESCMTRVSSKGALDNLRKQMYMSTGALDSTSLRSSFANMNLAMAQQQAANGGGMKNATFNYPKTGTRRSKKAPNMLLQALSGKKQTPTEPLAPIPRSRSPGPRTSSFKLGGSRARSPATSPMRSPNRNSSGAKGVAQVA